MFEFSLKEINSVKKFFRKIARKNVKKDMKKTWAQIAFSLMLVVFSQDAFAKRTFSDALGTVGLSTGAGTILGLSTLPFYPKPFDHTSNILVGAGVGFIVGIGLATYFHLSDNSDRNKIDYDQFVIPKKPKIDPKAPKNPAKTSQINEAENEKTIQFVSQPVPVKIQFLNPVELPVVFVTTFLINPLIEQKTFQKNFLDQNWSVRAPLLKVRF